jgi:hypothetical protein
MTYVCRKNQHPDRYVSADAATSQQAAPDREDS